MEKTRERILRIQKISGIGDRPGAKFYSREQCTPRGANTPPLGAERTRFHDFTVYPFEGIWQKTEEPEQDGTCAEILHIGAFDDEPVSFGKMEQFVLSNHLERTKSYHRELYLNNANRVEKSKLKTILRYAVI